MADASGKQRSRSGSRSDSKSGSSRDRSERRRRKRQTESERDRSTSQAADNTDQPSDPNDASSTETFRNYSYGPDKGFLRLLLLFLQLLAVVLLFVVCIAPPNPSGGSLSILRDTTGKEYVGVLRKCTDTTCDPWLGGSSSGSTTSASAGGATTNTGETTEPAKRSDPSSSPTHPFFPLLPIRAVHSIALRPRAEGDVDLPTMYLTTGLATLSALWILGYLFVLTSMRFLWLYDPPEVDSPGWRETFKRFIHRATRVWLVILCVLLGAILLDVAVKGAQYRSSKGLTGIDGVGPGIAIILFAWICCVICTLIELGGERIHAFFNSLSCGFEWTCGCLGREHNGKQWNEEEGIPMKDVPAGGKTK